jgi:hypothetical protein
MYRGARVTDAVIWHQKRGEVRPAVKIVRDREPERFRWRSAVSTLTKSAGRLRGRDRQRIEEPVREVVLDMSDRDLRREVVLDARRFGVDLDRGEVMPGRTVGDLRRFAFLTGADLTLLRRYIPHDPSDFFAPVDTSAVVIVGRAYADAHRRRAHELWLSVPDPDGPDEIRTHHRYMSERAEREAKTAERWAAFAKAVIEP